QRQSLVCSHSGNQREVVILPTSSAAVRAPATDRTVLDRLRIRCRGRNLARRFGDELAEEAAYSSLICPHIGTPKRSEVTGTECQVQPPRPVFLERGK